jgi:knotted carbamoyltransferase YgeW
MAMEELTKLIQQLEQLDCGATYNNDFLLTWDKSDDELRAVFTVADILRKMREHNISPRIFDSGLAVSIFRDNSTRTRFSFAGACNLLGLTVRDFDEGQSQVAHGETTRETSGMISFMADVIGIRDDMYIGKGHAYMRNVGSYVREGYEEGVLPQRPTLINLQCDIDHPTQSMADLLHLIHYFGGVEQLRGKKIAMSWAFSPSYGKPLSVPQGIIGLMTRMGMEVSLAYPEGYDLLDEVMEVAAGNAAASGGKFSRTNSMREAFAGADIVYPKSWASYAAMERRTRMYDEGDFEGIKQLERELLAENARHRDWECTEAMMKLTKEGKALYLHCLPADISGVSCKQGEVAASVFDRYRVPLYREAGYKPYIIAAMVFLSKVKKPGETLEFLIGKGTKRLIG